MTCPMTARLETTIFSVRSLNLLPGAQPNDGKGSAVPNRLTKGCALKSTKDVGDTAGAIQELGEVCVIGVISFIPFVLSVHEDV
jgi:hypothetical protein